MRQFTTFVGIALLCVGAIYCTVMALRRPPSGLLVAQDQVVFLGRMKQGQTGNCSFNLTNDTGTDIRVEKIAPSCSCTVTEIGSASLVQGQSVAFGAKFAVGDSRGRTFTSIMVLYKTAEEKRSRTLELRVVADVDPDYSVSRSRLVFPSTHKSSEAVVLTPNVLRELRIWGLESTHPAFSASVVPPGDTGDEWSVRVSFDPGRLKDSVIVTSPAVLIRTNSRNEPVHHLTLELSTR